MTEESFGISSEKILRFAQNDKETSSCRGRVSRPERAGLHVVPRAATRGRPYGEKERPEQKILRFAQNDR